MQKSWENRVAISTNQPYVCQSRQTVGHDPLTQKPFINHSLTSKTINN